MPLPPFMTRTKERRGNREEEGRGENVGDRGKWNEN